MYKYEALKIVGGLSHPSKMPCPAWGLWAGTCITGSKLTKVENSVCSKCYAFKGAYAWSPTIKANQRRNSILNKVLGDADYEQKFRDAFAVLLWKERWFRWFDTGDLQSVDHFRLLCDIAAENEHVLFWLPTREYAMVESYNGYRPSNLVVRMASHMIDHAPLQTDEATATVHTKGKKHYGYECKAYLNDNKCGDCVACWGQSHKNISYRLH